MITEATLRLAKVKKAYTIYEAIAHWMRYEAHAPLILITNQCHRGAYNFHGGTFDQLVDKAIEDLKEHSQEMDKEHFHAIHREYSFYFSAITEGCRFIELADIYSSKVSKEELVSMAIKLNEKPAFLFTETTKQKKLESLDPREKNALHILIAAFAKKLNIDPNSRDTTAKVKCLIEKAGLSMSEDAIRKHMKEAFQTRNNKTE